MNSAETAPCSSTYCDQRKCSAGCAHSAARIWRTIGHIACTTARLEATHHAWAWSFARGGRAFTLLHRKAGRVVCNDFVPVNAHLIVRGVAITTASVVNLEFEWCGTFIGATLNLGARRLQLASAKAIFHGVHTWVLLHERQ